MKRLLNLNGSIGLFVRVISLFILILPAALLLCGSLLRFLEIETGVITSLITVSLVVGGLIAFVWVALIVVEQVQDHLYDQHFRRQRKQALQLPDGYYECQYCGFRQLRAGNQRCPVCGSELTVGG